MKSKITAALFFKLIFWPHWVSVAVLGLSPVFPCIPVCTDETL